MGLGEYDLDELCHTCYARGGVVRKTVCTYCGIPQKLGPPCYLGLNLETAAAMEITRQSSYRRGFENAMAIKGICEPLEEEHAKRILAL